MFIYFTVYMLCLKGKKAKTPHKTKSIPRSHPQRYRFNWSGMGLERQQHQCSLSESNMQLEWRTSVLHVEGRGEIPNIKGGLHKAAGVAGHETRKVIDDKS